MKYLPLGNSDLIVSTIGFGTWGIGGWMWGGTNKKEAVHAIREAFNRGITTIDTAPAYGFGLSETLVGEAIRGRRQDFQILTKYGLRWNGEKGQYLLETKDNDGETKRIYKYAAKASVIEECEMSLRRLNTNYIDLYQIHWPDPTTPIDETMEAIETLIQSGKVRTSGVCNYSVEQMQEAEKTLIQQSNQIPYNMLNREPDNDIIPFCHKNGKGIIAWGPLERGLLTGKYKAGYIFPQGDHRSGIDYFLRTSDDPLWRLIELLKEIASEKGITTAQLTLSWTLKRKGMKCVLAGCRNAVQAKENAAAADIVIKEEEEKAIEKGLLELKKGR